MFVIPGIMFLIWLILSDYVLFAEGRKGISALTASWYYVAGYWKSVFWHFLFLFFVSSIISIVQIVSSNLIILNFFCLILFYFLFIPISTIYFYRIYNSLRQIKKTPVTEIDEQKFRRNIIIFALMGIIGLIRIILKFYYYIVI